MVDKDKHTSGLPVNLAPLPDGWAYRTLSDLVDPERAISYGVVQPGAFDPLGVPIVRVNNLRGNRIIDSEVFRVDPTIEGKYSRTRLRGGEILMSLVGTLGECAIVPKTLAGWNVARAVAVIPVTSDIDPQWVALCLRAQQAQHFIETWATTTVQATLNLRDVANLPIPLAPEFERSSIAQVMSALDDKIELNRRTNETLEEMARALFKSWFVDFDPVRAKMEGRQPLSMDDERAALFPNSFEDSALGEIPKGWSITSIDEAVKVMGGGTPSTKEPSFWDGGTHYWATPKDLSKLQSPVLLHTERKVTDAGRRKISSGLLPVGTVLLSSRAPIGYLAVAQVPVAVNQGFIAMLCNGSVTPHYVLHWTRINVEQIKGRAGGSTFPEISKKNFRTMLMLTPPQEILSAFESQVVPLYGKISANLRQSKTLAAIRDSLLPKLLSGEIRIAEVAEQIEEVL